MKMPWGTTLPYLYLPMCLVHDNKSAGKFAHGQRQVSPSTLENNYAQARLTISTSLSNTTTQSFVPPEHQDIVFAHDIRCLLELVPIAASRIPTEWKLKGWARVREGSQAFWCNEFSGPEICRNQGVWTLDLMDCMGGEANHKQNWNLRRLRGCRMVSIYRLITCTSTVENKCTPNDWYVLTAMMYLHSKTKHATTITQLQAYTVHNHEWPGTLSKH